MTATRTRARTGYSYAACIHEAGHAVIGTLMGLEIDYAYVKRAEDGKRPPWKGLIMIESRSDLWELASSPEQIHALPLDVQLSEFRQDERILLMKIAGIVAQIRHAGTVTAIATGGWGDMMAMKEIIGRWYERSDEVNLSARSDWIFDEARRLVRKCWPAVLEVAERLHAEGRLEGPEIVGICARHGIFYGCGIYQPPGDEQALATIAPSPADAETLGRLATGGSRLDGGQNTLAQVRRQGSRHDRAPAKVAPSNHNSNEPTNIVDSSRTETALVAR